MSNPGSRRNLLMCFVSVVLALSPSTRIGNARAQTYSWQKPHATVSRTGGLEWAPEPFVFENGAQVRYIDYENGSDTNDGLTRSTPWKHHPWDERATNTAAESSGVITYVFKRGVTYYMFEPQDPEGEWDPYFKADESGTPNEPIRLTVDPDWGTGEAVIAGSAPIPALWQQAGPDDVPNRMDHTNVWYIDAGEWWPRHPRRPRDKLLEEVILWEVRDGVTLELHLARDPDWQESHCSFALDYWHQWSGYLGDNWRDFYDEDLKGYPEDYFDGANVWSQYATFMGAPNPNLIQPGDYDPETGVLRSGGPWPGVKEGSRYMIENLPQFLDSPGEYYWDEDGTGRIYVRLWDDRDPNASQVEMSACFEAVSVDNQSFIEVSGLTFTRFGRQCNAVRVTGTGRNITVTNCNFKHLAGDGVYVRPRDEGDTLRAITISDNDFAYIQNTAIGAGGKSRGLPRHNSDGILVSVDVLRNRTYETGFRQTSGYQSNVPAIDIGYPFRAEIAGNVVTRSFGSGIVVHGGKAGGDPGGRVVPLTRILVHHNKIENTALGVNDYGGLAIWQGGPMYVYNNISGNAVGHIPGGFVYNSNRDMNLSYPIYLDGAYKTYTFNNITWGRTTDENDPYHSRGSAYFMVFGFLNPVIHNTFYRSGIGLGGSSGNRNDVLGNLFVDIKSRFLKNNRTLDPSLVGGGDDGSSGLRGIPTLAYADNLFHGTAEAGVLAKKGDSVGMGAEMDIEAEEITAMAAQMKVYPLRCGRLGWEEENRPIKTGLPDPIDCHKGISDGNLRPHDTTLANNNGVTYFIPWSLYATVGEWHFMQNRRNPREILDYHWFMNETHVKRKAYEAIPYFTLSLSDSTLDAYTESYLEDWAPGAVVFDGSRFAAVGHEEMHRDIEVEATRLGEKPVEPWITPEPDSGYDHRNDPIYGPGQIARFPGDRRRTLDISTENVLVETVVRVDAVDPAQNGVIAGKYDGNTGYRLYVTPTGLPEFEVAAGGSAYRVAGVETITDGEWHHVIGEIDRKSGRMSMYVDGSLSNESSSTLAPEASLSNTADFIVGKGNEDTDYFMGAIDFLRVCKGTLADAATTIEELYAWQTDGPVRYDFAGNPPMGRRDIGALENGDITVTRPNTLLGWDFAGQDSISSYRASYFHESVSQTDPSGTIVMSDAMEPHRSGEGDGFTFKNREFTYQEALDSGRYIEFTIAPREGDTLDFTEIYMYLTTARNTPLHYALFSGDGSFTQGNEIVHDSLPPVWGSVDLPLQGFETVTQPTKFRLYFYGKKRGVGGILDRPGYDLMIRTGGRVGVAHKETKEPESSSGLFKDAVRSAIEAGRGE